MAPIKISALGRKFRLLIDYGAVDNFDELANKFERKSSTLQWWCHGDDARAPNMLPRNRMPHFEALAAKALGTDSNDNIIRNLATVEAAEFELALQNAGAPTLQTILNAESENRIAHIYYKPKIIGNLIEVDSDELPATAVEAVRLNTWFRMELDLEPCHGKFIVLQQAGVLWGAVPSHYDGANEKLLIPGINESNEITFMIERTPLITSRFIVIETKKAFLPFQRYLSDQIALGPTQIAAIASFYSEQRKTERRISVSHVSFKN